jgi:adenine-specific DNA glycosylase
MIGKPGAEKILVIAGGSTRLALDSNGLRVLLRVGYGAEDKSYDKAYRSVVDQAARQAAMTAADALAAHLLLRELGKSICRRAAPRCEACPLNRSCRFAAANRDGDAAGTRAAAGRVRRRSEGR